MHVNIDGTVGHYCCAAMFVAWETGYIGWNIYQNSVQAMFAASTARVNEMRFSWQRIDHCPFCGAGIQCAGTVTGKP